MRAIAPLPVWRLTICASARAYHHLVILGYKDQQVVNNSCEHCRQIAEYNQKAYVCLQTCSALCMSHATQVQTNLCYKDINQPVSQVRGREVVQVFVRLADMPWKPALVNLVRKTTSVCKRQPVQPEPELLDGAPGLEPD